MTPFVQFDGLPGDRQPQTEACSVGHAALRECLAGRIRALGEATALVFHFDTHVAVVTEGAERHAPAGVRVLEGIVVTF